MNEKLLCLYMHIIDFDFRVRVRMCMTYISTISIAASYRLGCLPPGSKIFLSVLR